MTSVGMRKLDDRGHENMRFVNGRLTLQLNCSFFFLLTGLVIVKLAKFLVLIAHEGLERYMNEKRYKGFWEDDLEGEKHLRTTSFHITTDDSVSQNPRINQPTIMSGPGMTSFDQLDPRRGLSADPLSQGSRFIAPKGSPERTPNTNSSPEGPAPGIQGLRGMFPNAGSSSLNMPLPGAPGTPCFMGANVTEFLERYEELCEDYGLTERERLTKLPRYCFRPIGERIKSWQEWEEKEWGLLRENMLMEFKKDDGDQDMFSVPFLEQFKNVKRMDSDDLVEYCNTFDRIYRHLARNDQITSHIGAQWLLCGLPRKAAEKVVRKFDIGITKGSEPLPYRDILAFVVRFAKQERALNDLDRVKPDGEQAKKRYEEVLHQMSKPLVVTKEQRLREPVVSAPSDPSNAVIEGLAASFDKLRIALVSQVPSQDHQGGYQGSQGGDQRWNQNQYNQSNDQQRSYNSGVYNSSFQGQRAQNQGTTEYCYYCYGQFPNMPFHRYRNDCPLYKQHFEDGLAHFAPGPNGKLCLGNAQNGSYPMRIDPNVAQWIQVRDALRAQNMEWKRAEYRPSEKGSGNQNSSRAATVGSISLVIRGSDEESDEEVVVEEEEEPHLEEKWLVRVLLE